MHVRKRALSILLVAAMLCSLIVFSNAETKVPGIHNVGPGDLTGGFAQVVGQETVVSYDTLTGNPIIEVKFKFFLDDIYHAFYSGHFLLRFDEEYLTYNDENTLRVFVGGVRNNNYQVFGPDPGDEHVIIGSDTLLSEVQTSWLGADGCAAEITFRFNPTSKFADLDPSVGTEVEFEYYYNYNADHNDFNVLTATEEIDLEMAKLLPSIPAVVTYASGNMLTYDVGDGVRANMDAFKPVIVTPGTNSNIADGTGLVISAEDSGDDVAKAFDHWVDQDGITRPAGSTLMPVGGFELTAVYGDDANEDGISDNKQMKVTYTLRSDDEGTLAAPTGTTANGKFITEGDNKVIYVTSGNTIGNSIATLDLTAPGLDDWDFAGYFIGSTEYTAATLSAMTVTAPITIELRASVDTNNNGIDDRDTVTLKFYEPDGVTEVGSIDVLDRTPYTVYKEPAKATTLDSGEAGEAGDPTEVTLPAVPGTIPGGKHTGWSIEPIMDGTEIIGVNAVPVYSDEQQVEIPDLRDPVDPEKPIEPPIVELGAGSIMIHNGIDGNPVGDPITIGSNDAIQVIEHPVPGEHANLPERDTDGNPFVGWVLSDPDVGAGPEGQDVYYLDPYYAKPIKVTIEDPKSKNTLDDNVILDGFNGKDVPVDATYEIVDDEGNVIDSGKMADNGGKVTLPFTEDIPARNEDGDIFTGDWVVTEEENDDGSPKYVITPEYAAPTEDDIIISVDEDDDANGNGLNILKGFYTDDVMSTAKFYVRIGNGPATASDAGRFNIVASPAFGFEKILRPSVIVGDLSAVTYVGTKTIEGVEYGEFSVTYGTIKSGIVKIAMSYGSVVPTEVPGGYIIVTVADSTKDGKVTASDISEDLKILNEKKAEPAKGEAGEYLYELADATVDGKITSSDLNIVIKMINEKVISN